MKALIIVDMINEFVNGRLGSDNVRSIVDNVKSLLTTARNNGTPVFFLTDSHHPEDRELKIWGPHAIDGTSESKIISELMPDSENPNEHIVKKNDYSAFFDDEFVTLLNTKEIDTLYFTGTDTAICVMNNVGDAYHLGFNIVIVADAVASYSTEMHDFAMRYMKDIYGAKFVTTEEAVREL